MSKVHHAMVVPGSLRTETKTYVSEWTCITMACPGCDNLDEYELGVYQAHRGTVRCHGCSRILAFDLNAARPSDNVFPLRRKSGAA